MPAPILTPTEILALQKQMAAQQNFADTLSAAVPQKQAKAAEYAVVDGAFKKYFDYYNDDIIGNYDDEHKALNGRFIALPIVEADVVGPASIDPSWRTTPTLPQTDIIRIAQFDGGGTSTVANHEQAHIAQQLAVEDALVNGYTPTGGFDSTTAETDSAINSLSTTMDVVDPTNPLTIAVGAKIVISNGSAFAVVQITSVTDNMGGDPPYEFTYGITFVVPPVGNILSGATLLEFTGFTNGERTTKTASDPDLQPVMDGLVISLQTAWFNRIARLNEQLTALAGQQDPDATVQTALAVTNANTSKTFLNSVFSAADISNTGLGILATERALRSGQITARLAYIDAAYTGQSEHYYNRRYQVANDRGNTQRGTLRFQKATEQSVTTMSDYADSAQDAADAIDAILP